MSEEVAVMESSHNIDNPIEPVSCMVQTKSITKHHIDYGKGLKKGFMFKVNAIKFLMGSAAIISQIIYDAHYKETGPWFMWYYFVNFLISLAGFFGMIISVKPSFSTLCISIVMSILSSVISFLLSIALSKFIGEESQRSINYDTSKLILFAIQFTIALIQVNAAIMSTFITCKTVSKCSRNMNRRENAYHDNNERSNVTVPRIGNQPIVYNSHQAGYVTIPISEIQGALVQNVGMTSPTGTAICDEVNDGEESEGEQYLPSAPPDYD